MSEIHSQVQFVRIEQPNHGQRVDNFLFRELKGVPRSRIYRFIRRGEVRINKKRCKPETKLAKGDLVRIPPHEPGDVAKPQAPGKGLVDLLQSRVLHEDENLLIINKPAGLAVHGGTGVQLGLIEAIRQIRSDWQKAELAHRLDRDTSGCLVLCKNMSYLKNIQQQLKAKAVEKDYLALVYGSWPDRCSQVHAPLSKNHLSSGERIVRVDQAGKRSTTNFEVIQRYSSATLLKASPLTGRTHQIRVHCQSQGHSIVGDEKYRAGDSHAPEQLKRCKQLCLHAERIRFAAPESARFIEVVAEPEAGMKAILQELN